MEQEVYIFPIRNEQGFKVNTPEDYMHVMRTIMAAAVELEYEYPDKQILVCYEV